MVCLEVVNVNKEVYSMNALLWIDRFLSRGLTYLFFILIFAGSYYLGVVSIPFIYSEFYEYKEMLWDISNAEIVYVLLLLAVLYRHVVYCVKYKAGLFIAVTWPFSALGGMAIFYLALIGSTGYLSTDSPVRYVLGLITDVEGAINQHVLFISTFLAIYIVSPTSPDDAETSEAISVENKEAKSEQQHQEEKSL